MWCVGRCGCVRGGGGECMGLEGWGGGQGLRGWGGGVYKGAQPVLTAHPESP